MDGSEKNISDSLGNMHKIRNFYNNIVDPEAEDGSVTMDTHAVAAGLISPLSGTNVYISLSASHQRLLRTLEGTARLAQEL